jgi:hypothetical protein
MTLYSYCLRFDDGAAPNPYWGICTLAICKPAIRRTAAEGDWVLGLGSKNSPIGNVSLQMVYVMRVTKILSMKDYDTFCRKSLPAKMPDWTNSDFRRKMGDCIYDFGSQGVPTLRRSIHTERNRKTDLSGLNVLLSTNFYYFGDKPVALPERLLVLVHPTQGHKSRANGPYAPKFVEWLERGGWKKNSLLGQPQLKDTILSMTEEECRNVCSEQDSEEDESEEIC